MCYWEAQLVLDFLKLFLLSHMALSVQEDWTSVSHVFNNTDPEASLMLKPKQSIHLFESFNKCLGRKVGLECVSWQLPYLLYHLWPLRPAQYLIWNTVHVEILMTKSHRSNEKKTYKQETSTCHRDTALMKLTLIQNKKITTEELKSFSNPPIEYQ